MQYPVLCEGEQAAQSKSTRSGKLTLSVIERGRYADG